MSEIVLKRVILRSSHKPECPKLLFLFSTFTLKTTIVMNRTRLLCFLFVTFVASINRSWHHLNLNEALPFRLVSIMADEHTLESEGAFGSVPDDIEVPRRPRTPIQGSVAGASIASHGSVAVFGRATRRTLDKIIQDEVIVRKGDRGAPGLKIFVTNRSAATQALPIKFLGSFHLRSKNAAGENNQKAKHIQEEFVCNLDVVKKFLERVVQYDMKTPL
jgi:hypothetical protein